MEKGLATIVLSSTVQPYLVLLIRIPRVHTQLIPHIPTHKYTYNVTRNNMTSPKSLNLQSEYITHSSDQGLAVGDAGKDSIVSSVLRCSLVGKSNTTQIKRHTHYDQIDQRLYKWMRAQHMFFVGTGPVPGCGAPNCSPKGLAGTVAVINSNTIAYLDSYGSGIETIAHLEQTGSNICIMMVAFEGTPLVLRLHGR